MNFFAQFCLAITLILLSLSQAQTSENELTLMPGKSGMNYNGIPEEEANDIILAARTAFPVLRGKEIVSVQRSQEGFTLEPEQKLIVTPGTNMATLTETYIISHDFQWVEQQLIGKEPKRVSISGRAGI